MVLVPSIRIAYSSPSSKNFASATKILQVGIAMYETKTIVTYLLVHRLFEA